MRYLDLLARFILGVGFVFFGLTYFLPIFPATLPENMPDAAKAWIGGLGGAPHYLTIVKIVEILGGALVASGRALPLGLVLLAPIVINIVYFNSYLLGAPNIDVLLLAAGLYLAYSYRFNFCGLFSASKKQHCE